METFAADELFRSLNQPEIDFLLLAERAEVVDNKLYVMGGGYERLFVENDLPTPFGLSFAVGVNVPWNACNQEHRLDLAVVDVEGNEIGFKAEISFTMGRGALVTNGQAQRWVAAVPSAIIVFPSTGSYFLRATLNGVSQKEEAIHVAKTNQVRAA